ncbi:MAG: hypothetical protein KDA93_24690 [Planctomycetaceae bacterium]|nr:hypothetical protein [Planctomycetaceae bacterium]
MPKLKIEIECDPDEWDKDELMEEITRFVQIQIDMAEIREALKNHKRVRTPAEWLSLQGYDTSSN